MSLFQRIFTRRKTNNTSNHKGFSLVELIVVIGIMAVMVTVFAPALVGYVEKTRANDDLVSMEEVIQAVSLGLTKDECYNALLKYRVTDNVSCYIDKENEAGYDRIVTNKASDKYNEQYKFDEDSRVENAKPYYGAGNMSGVTLTFEPSSGSEGNKYNIKDAVINKFDPDGGQKLIECEPLYNAIRRVVGEEVELESATYRNSDFTIFIRMTSYGSSEINTEDKLEIYGQYNGTNLPQNIVETDKTTNDRGENPGNPGGPGGSDDDDGEGSGGNGNVDPDNPGGSSGGGDGGSPGNPGGPGGPGGSDGNKCPHTSTTTRKVAEPTCVQDGYTGDTMCVDCGKVISQGTVRPQLGHDIQETIIDSTCTEDGYTVCQCTRCDYGYRYKNVKACCKPGPEPTCTTDQLCKDCGKVMALRLGHDHIPTVVPPTCLTDGYTRHVCWRCEDTYDTDPKEALGHIHGPAVTCLTDEVCIREGCGDVLIPALGHVPGAAATCTTDQICTRSGCGDILTDRLEHSYNIEAATCTTSKKCTRSGCGHVAQNALGHSWSETGRGSASCNSDGYINYKCTRSGCGATTSDTLYAYGHSWYTYSSTKAVCNRKGTAYQRCSNCGGTRSVGTGYGDHEWELFIHYAGTCQRSGYNKYNCIHCSNAYTETLGYASHVANSSGKCRYCGKAM